MRIIDRLLVEISFTMPTEATPVLPWSWEEQTPTSWSATFDFGTKSRMSVECRQQSSTKDVWEIDFDRTDYRHEPERLPLAQMLPVFRTVEQIVRAFVKAKQPKSLWFEANTIMHQQLYDQWTTAIKTTTDPVWKQYRVIRRGDMGSAGMRFTLMRRE